MNPRLQYLFDRAGRFELSSEERSELSMLLQTSESDEVEALLQSWLRPNMEESVNAQKSAAILESIFSATVESSITNPHVPSVRRVRFLKTAWFRYAAAILILIIGVSLYYIFSHTSQPETAVVQHVPPASGNDVLPGFNRAVLTLSNGQKVELDSGATETITDGTLSIENNNGVLSYSALPSAPHTRRDAPLNAPAEGIAYNTMATPRGGQYQLTLADGTKVWLNAASSITYPTAFAGAKREVTITGEAYFEVSKNKEKPFIVKTPADEITVLGTSFNVNAYADEPFMKISLAEGAVKVGQLVLQPGQAFHNGKIVATNLEQDLAWKNGYFNMQGADIRAIMRAISRWYNVDVIYKGEIPGTFRVQISRFTTLSDVLKILEATGEVKPEIKGNTVIIQ